MKRRTLAAFDVMALQLAGRPVPPLPAIAGHLIAARDEPLPPELLAEVIEARELALLAGISRQAAYARLAKQRITPNGAATASESTT